MRTYIYIYIYIHIYNMYTHISMYHYSQTLGKILQANQPNEKPQGKAHVFLPASWILRRGSLRSRRNFRDPDASGKWLELDVMASKYGKVWLVGWGGGVVEGGVLTAPHDVTGFKCMINNHGEFSKVPKAWGCGTPSKWPCPSWRF